MTDGRTLIAVRIGKFVTVRLSAISLPGNTFELVSHVVQRFSVFWETLKATFEFLTIAIAILIVTIADASQVNQK